MLGRRRQLGAHGRRLGIAHGRVVAQVMLVLVVGVRLGVARASFKAHHRGRRRRAARGAVAKRLLALSRFLLSPLRAQVGFRFRPLFDAAPFCPTVPSPLRLFRWTSCVARCPFFSLPFLFLLRFQGSFEGCVEIEAPGSNGGKRGVRRRAERQRAANGSIQGAPSGWPDTRRPQSAARGKPKQKLDKAAIRSNKYSQSLVGSWSWSWIVASWGGGAPGKTKLGNSR